jgi:ankyrin repeat protein
MKRALFGASAVAQPAPAAVGGGGACGSATVEAGQSGPAADDAEHSCQESLHAQDCQAGVDPGCCSDVQVWKVDCGWWWRQTIHVLWEGLSRTGKLGYNRPTAAPFQHNNQVTSAAAQPHAPGPSGWDSYVRATWGRQLESALGLDWEQYCGHDASAALLLWALQSAAAAAGGQPATRTLSRPGTQAVGASSVFPVTAARMLAAMMPEADGLPASTATPAVEPQQQSGAQVEQQQQPLPSPSGAAAAVAAAAAAAPPRGGEQLAPFPATFTAGSDGGGSSPLLGSPTKRKIRVARTRQRTSGGSGGSAGGAASWQSPLCKASAAHPAPAGASSPGQHAEGGPSPPGGCGVVRNYLGEALDLTARLQSELETRLLLAGGGGGAGSTAADSGAGGEQVEATIIISSSSSSSSSQGPAARAVPPAVLQLLHPGRRSAQHGGSTTAGALALLDALSSLLTAAASTQHDQRGLKSPAAATSRTDGAAVPALNSADLRGSSAGGSGSSGSSSSPPGVGALLDGGHPAGVTPLHVAACLGRADVVERLAMAGCDPDRRARVELPMEEALAGALAGARDQPRTAGAEEGASDEGSGALRSSQNGAVACPLLLPAGALACSALLSGGEPLAVGVTPLHVAAAAGQVEVVGALLRVPGIDVNARTAQGFAPLHLAAQRGHAGVVDALARAPGADINARDGAAATPLHHAAAARRGAVVDALWPRRVDLDARDAAGRTPLHLAAAAAGGGEGLEVVGKLVIAGCDVGAADDAGFTAGHVAAFNGEAQIGVLSGLPCLLCTISSRPPLHTASVPGHMMVLEKLLLAGWDLDHAALPSSGKQRAPSGKYSGGGGSSGGGAAPTQPGARSAGIQPPVLVTPEAPSLPRGWGPDPLVLQPHGATALLLAAAGDGRDACLSWLLASGARRGAIDGRGAPALMVAAAAGQWDAFGVLLSPVEDDEAGEGERRPRQQEGKGSEGPAAAPPRPELRAVDSTGRSLLHAAAYGGCRRTLRYLVDAGLDPAVAAPDSSGRSCLHHLALGAGGRAAGELLLGAGCAADARDAAGSLPWHLAAHNGHSELMELLLARGADPASSDGQGCTALHLAAAGDLEAAVELLLSSGAPLDAHADGVGTPLHAAAAAGAEHTVRRMLRAGTAVDMSAVEGWTPLALAAAGGHVSVVQQLLAGGAKVNFGFEVVGCHGL